MSIDAVIAAVRHCADHSELWLRPRIDRDGIATSPGQRRLRIAKNAGHTPRAGEEVWGNSSAVVITADDTDYIFPRLPRAY